MKKALILISLLAILPISCNQNKAEVTIIYTNDVHGQIDGKISYATVGQMKKDLIAQGNNVLLLDSGDHISGGLFTSYDKGASMVKAMSYAGYDAATFGNHEFDYNMDYLKEICNTASYPYLTCNFYHMKDGKPTDRFTRIGSKVFNFNNISIGVIGVATPDSKSTSNPKYFQDEKGNPIYTFFEDNLCSKIQEEIDSIKGISDFVVCMSHIGNEEGSNYMSEKIVQQTTGLTAVLDGHTHKTLCSKIVKDKNNKDVLITQTGSHFKNIGKLTISKNGTITNEFINEYSGQDKKIKDLETEVVDGVNKRLSEKIATSNIKFTCSGEKESNMGDLVAESPYYYYNSLKDTSCDFTFVNSGAIRHDTEPSTWTYKTCKLIHPFENQVCLKKIKGSVIKTALEFSTYKVPDYFGGLQQTCGIKFSVDPSIKSDIVVDGGGNYVSGPTKGHERVSEIKVYDKTLNQYVDFDINKEYLVGGSAYVLINCGDGCSMFKEGEIIRVEGDLTDYTLFANYIKNFDKPLGAELPVISSSTSPLKKFKNLLIDYENEGYGQRIIIKK